MLFQLRERDPSESILTRIKKSLMSIINKSDSEVTTCGGLSKGVLFHVNSKDPKAVEILLQRMFSTEFDIAEDDLVNIPECRI